MLFATLDAQKVCQINNTENLILDLEKQLELARLQLSQLQQEVQSQKSAKSAAETALEMVSRAKALISFAYGSEGLQEFDQALLDISFNEPDPTLLLNAAIDLDDDSKTEPEPDSPSPEPVTQTQIIDVIPDAVVTNDDDNEDDTDDDELDFSRISWTRLQRLAAGKGISPKGKKRNMIERELRTIGISQLDIDAA